MMPDSDFAGVVSGCTVEDRPALWELCNRMDPLAPWLDIAASLRNENVGSWAVYRDNNREIRVAVFMQPGGTVHMVMKPEDMCDPVVKQGFLQLAQEVHRAFKMNGVADLVILCPERLKPFVQMLSSEGFLSREVYTAHGMHFTPAGDIDRAQ
jgi:hypothetical protein